MVLGFGGKLGATALRKHNSVMFLAQSGSKFTCGLAPTGANPRGSNPYALHTANKCLLLNFRIKKYPFGYLAES